MAVKYLAGDRLIGTAAERTALSGTTVSYATPTFENDFDSNTGWTQSGSTITVDDHVTDKCSINDPATSSTHRVYRGLGITLNDTTWLCTCEINISAMSNDERAFPICFSSTTGSYRSSHDSVAIRLGGGLTSMGGSSKDIGMSRNDGGSVIHLTDANSIAVSVNTTYYVKFYRESGALKLAVFTGSDYATGQVGSTQTHQSISSPTGLDNIVIGSDDGSTGGVNATVDNVKVFNNSLVYSTSTPFYPFLPNGAIFEESDTGKHYMFDGTSAWNEM